MKRKITLEIILKFAGWAALLASIVLISMRLIFNEQIAFHIIISGFSSGAFCLYLGYLHKNFEE